MTFDERAGHAPRALAKVTEEVLLRHVVRVAARSMHQTRVRPRLCCRADGRPESDQTKPGDLCFGKRYGDGCGGGGSVGSRGTRRA